MRFSSLQLNLFQALSGDSNPLHHDVDYARRSSFGEPVVFGVCAVVYALAEWAQARSFSMHAISVQFKKPLFVGIEYDLQIEESAETVKIGIYRGTVLQSKILVNLRSSDRKEKAKTFTETEKIIYQRESLKYQLREEFLPQFLEAFHLKEGQFVPLQLKALLWASFFVGTEFPGVQALFSGLEIVFEPSFMDKGSLEIQNILATEDERFQLATIMGKGAGIRYFTLQAFRRPKPLYYSLADIREQVCVSQRLCEKKVFISGASRGFGSVLARVLALQGADLILNYKSGREEAEVIAKEIELIGRKVLLLPGNVGAIENCINFRDQIIEKCGEIDILIHNAFSPIRPMYFLEQSPQDFNDYVVTNIALTSTLSYVLLPIIRRKGTVLNISTTFTSEPEPQFSHYVTVKGATEALMKALSVEFPEIYFKTVNLPKMLTDQTAKPGMLSKTLASPIDQAVEVLDRLVS